MTGKMKIRNILVTGASGKIGRNLIPALLAEGYSVRAVQNRTPVRTEGVEVVKGSVSDYAFIEKALDDVDAVCHLATTKEDKPGFLEVSVRGTWNLLEASKECGHVCQFVISSGDAALGIFFYPNPEPLSEDSPLRAYPGVYALSKVLEDTLVLQHGIQYGLPYTILRFSWIFDEDDILAYMTFRKPNFGGPSWRSLAKTTEQKRFFEEDTDGVGCLMHPGGAPFKRHIVAVADVVQSIMLALANPRAVGETFHIAAPEPFSYDVLSRYIAEKLDIPAVDFELDGFHDFEIDSSKARSVLGYRPEYDAARMVDAAIAFRKSGRTRTQEGYGG